MLRHRTSIKYASIFVTIALLLIFGYLLTSNQTNTDKQTPTSSASSDKSAHSRLRDVVDATVAKLGTTGWTEVNTSTKEVIVFDPSSKLNYQIASYKPGSSYKPTVLGSIMIGPFELMWKLEEDMDDYKVYETSEGFGLKWVDTAENGTSVTEYEIKDGVLVSATIRDRIGKKNELNVLTKYFYGLDTSGKQALDYANQHLQEGGHD